MNRIFSILLLVAAAGFLLRLTAVAATNSVPPMPMAPVSSPPTVPSYNPRDIVYSQNYTNVANGVTNVTSIRVIENPVPEPTQTTIRLKFHDQLNTNALYTVDFTCPRNCAFAGWEIIEE